MKLFLPLALIAGLLSPIAASADDFKVRDTCGRLARNEITGKEAFKRLKLKKTYGNGQKVENFMRNAAIYCAGYIKGEI